MKYSKTQLWLISFQANQVVKLIEDYQATVLQNESTDQSSNLLNHVEDATDADTEDNL